MHAGSFTIDVQSYVNIMTVDEDEFELDEDMVLYNGVPFSGTGIVNDIQGIKVREIPYTDGFPHGICNEWYSSGAAKRRWESVRGTVNGALTEWHENGKVKSITIFIYGVELTYDEWDCTGQQVSHRELDPDSKLAEYARILMQRHSQYG